MFIRKLQNGTINYSGIAFDFLNFYFNTLNIRYYFGLLHCVIADDMVNRIITKQYRGSFPSYEYVPLRAEYIRKYGAGPAQAIAIANDVRYKQTHESKTSCSYTRSNISNQSICINLGGRLCALWCRPIL